LIPPAYVKPFVKRQKNDAADAEAIAEAASRPTMRFVAVKTEEQQARAMLFRTRDLLVRQRTQLINALRGQLSEHGVVAPQGPANVAILAQATNDMTSSLPLLVVELARLYLDQIDGLSEKVAGLEKAIACEAKRGAMTRRLQTMPGVGPITAMAIETFAPPMDVFHRGRDFAAWLGLVPLQHSTEASRFSGKLRNRGSAIFAGC
jgi:transposase